MARENRKENRAAASAAKAETPKEKTGYELDDLIDSSGTEDEPEFSFDERVDNDDDNDALGSEIRQASGDPETPPNVEKKGEEDKEEEEVSVGDLTGDEEKGEVAEGEKPVEKKPDEAKTETEPTTTEPTPKEEPSKPIEVPSETLTDQQAQELFTNWRTTTEDLLAKHHYKLSEADVDAFNENPAEFIPRYASRVYLDSISAAFQQFTTYLPRMVDQVLEMRKSGDANEAIFFGRWPELKSHVDVVQRLGRAYRNENPSASMEDFVNEVGAQAMVALRKVPSSATPPPTPNGNGQAKPFKPASGSPANERIQPKKPANQWEEMTSEFSSMTEEDLEES